MKKLITNQKCIVWTLLTTLIIFSAVNIAWALPVDERTQQVQDAIVAAVDGVSAAADVTDTHLAAITTLNLRSKGITALKTGDFEGLSALTDLNLYGNQLSSLPDGIFEGLTALTTLRLGNNTVDPMSISVSLEKVADGQFKVVVPTGAPFALVILISAMNGSITGDATTLTISQGSVESEALTITRTDGTTDAVTVDIGTLPGLPSNHYGYTVSKSDTESLEVIGEVVVSTEPDPTPPEIDPTPPEIDPTPPEIDPEPEPPANSAPTFSDGTMAVRAVAENTDAGVNIGATVAATDTDSDDTLTYTLSGTDAGSFDIDATTGQLKTKAALDYETRRVYAVTITVSDGSLTDTITVFINVIDRADTTLTSTSVSVSARTAEVRDAIVAAVSDVSDAADVTATHLATITTLDLWSVGISSLESGDFGGLTGLTNLNLYGNQLSSLPVGIFSGLTALTTLRLGGNTVDPMPLIVSLQLVDANQYQAIIPAGAPFDVALSIDATTVTIPQGSVKSDTFTVTGVPVIGALPMLPANHFGYVLAKSAVCNRTTQVAEAIAVAVPGVTDCQNVAEIDIAGITALDLSNKSITSLKEGDFSGMLSLTMLELSNNQLSSLPFGIFEGLSSLKTLNLSGNTVDPLPFPVSLEKVGEDQFKAVLPTGAPFAINLSVVVMTGNIASSAITVIIPQGSVESGLQTITRTEGTTAAVSVDIGTFPSLPAMHSGYALAKSDTLPLEILEDINVAPVFTDGSTTTRSIAENTDAGVNIGSAVAATDANNDTLTYTLSGDDAGSFDIVSTTGQLQTKAALDYETDNSYSVTITVSDSRLTDTIAVTINVTDKSELPSTDDAESVAETNNAPMFSEGNSATRSIAENTGSGVDIGSPISATDDDDDTLEYSLGGVNAGSFSLDTTTGQLRTSAALDFETKSSYTVEVTVSDSTDTVTITVTINVTDIDEAVVNIPPVFTEGSSAIRSVAENTGSGVDIGTTVAATDADEDTLTYNLSGTDASVFSIDSSSGQLRTSAPLDHETKDTYTVTITVSDRNGGSATITVTINITDVDEIPDNSAPVFIEGSSATRSVAENTGSGVDIGSAVSATDDNGDTLAWTLGGTDGAAFSIDSTTGQLRTSATLDHETKDTYSVTITVSDGNGGSATITVTISVTDVGETPTNNVPVFTEGSSTTRSVAENTGSGVDIGTTVAATDADEDTLTYNLSGTDASVFSIDSSSGQLRTSVALDFETKDTYSVTITVSDGKGGSATITVTINITDVDETPANNDPVFTEGSSATRSVTENTGSGVDIGSAVSATDDDNDTLSYSLSGSDASSFSIDSSSGQLQTSATLDYESKPSYSVTITVSDENGGSATITVTISVTNVNESLEFTDGTSTARAIAENAPAGTNIGNAVAATDDDGDTLTYTLGGTDAAAFDIESTTGQLKTKATLDFETKSSYTVVVSVSDSKGGTDSITVTINVTDLDETPSNNPPVFTAGNDPITLTIAENMPAGTNVGDPVSATDADESTLAYLLSGDDASAFSIDDDGQLKTSASLNHETKSSYTVTITVTDGSLTDSIAVTINVTDVNETPTFTAGDTATRAVAENTDSDVNIGAAVAATDPDKDTLEYTLSGDDASAFTIDSDSGQLKTKSPLDFETNNSYSVTITVDDGSLTDTITVTISVTDVDENRAPVFTNGDNTTRSIAENTGSGVNIGATVAATDADEDTLEYTLGGDDADAFDIGSTTGQLRTKSPLDFETKDSYELTVTVSDDNGGSAEIEVAITITDVDENVAPVFTDEDHTTREVAENTGPGVNIGTAVAATDANNDNLTYSLGGTDAAAFDIGSTTGQLRTKAPLDFETKDSYEVTVTVSDGKGGSDTITVTISVTDVDENVAPVFTDDDSTTREVAENTGSGVNIGNPVAATDANNDTLTYTLGGTNADAFDIGSTTGQLRTKAPLDFETKNSYSVTITVDDDNGGSDEIEVAITVTDVDENVAPVFSDGDRTTRSIAENTGSDANIGNPVAATDANNDSLTYSLSGTDAASFSINIANGQLHTHAALDYETDDTYSVSIMVRDENGGSDEIAVTISVTDVNEAPMFTVGDSTTREVAENTAAGENIGSVVSATDVDNDDLTYTLSGTDAASFSIVSGTGQLQTSAALDYETDDTYSVTITVSDGSLTDSISVTINITDVDENRAPEFSDGTSTTRSVAENTASGENIGAPVAATDADNNTLTYTLGGTNASSFSIDSGTGQLKTSAVLDYETKDTYSVTITVSDDNGGSAEIEVAITITDVDENVAPVFTDGDSTTRSVAENTASGENIGAAVAATDVNSGDTLTYSLGGTDAAAFSIDSGTGQLKTSAALDYETKDSYEVTITVSDRNGGSDSITITIKVDNVNDAPAFTEGDSTTRSVPEYTARGTNIGEAISATDQEGDTLTYTLGGANANAVNIDSQTGQLKTKRALFYKTVFSLMITVSDGNGGTATINVAVTVTDVDIGPPSFAEGDSTTRSVDEDAQPGTHIGAPIIATDPENRVITREVLVYSLGGTDAASFDIEVVDSNNDGFLDYVQLKTKALLDYDTQSSYTVTITVKDIPIDDWRSANLAAWLEDRSPVYSFLNEDTITVTINVNEVPESTLSADLTPISDRTKAVADAIKARAGVDHYNSVTDEHLTAITSLNIRSRGIRALKVGDFDGLTNLNSINLDSNKLTTLPSGVFDGLANLNTLNLSANDITGLPSDVFSGLSNLRRLQLGSNANASGQNLRLHKDVFDGLSSLTTLELYNNNIRSLNKDIFDDLTSLQTLELNWNSIKTLNRDIFENLTSLRTLLLFGNAFNNLEIREDIFDGLSSLRELDLTSNDLTSLPSNIFDGLSSLTQLDISHNKLSSLPADVFDGLTSLTEIDLVSQRDGNTRTLSSLPSNIFTGLSSLSILRLEKNNLSTAPSFSGLSSLSTLRLQDNNISSLPDGIFKGVSSLSLLWLQRNAVNPLPINISLEKVGTDQVKAKAHTGAPFEMSIEVSVTNGSLADDGTILTIPTGALESSSVTVTRTAGTTAAVTVDISVLPDIPSDLIPGSLYIDAYHRGYTLAKSATGLPLEITAAVGGAPQLTKDAAPAETALLSNYPNPANPETWIPYQLAKPADVSLTIYNVRGVVVRKLALGHQQAGVYMSRDRAAHWDGKNKSGESVASGVYFYVFKAGEYTALRKMLIRK